MEMSLAEAVLHGLAEDSGVEPDGDLLERLRATPPAALRRLRRLDPEVLELCGVAPFALAHGLVTLLESGVGDDGLLDRERAWERIEAAGDDDPEEPEVTESRLLEVAHAVLGLPAGCTACRDALSQARPETQKEELEAHGHGEDAHAHGDDGAGILGTVFEVHADALDSWEQQVGYLIAGDAAEAMADVAGFELLHEVVGQNVPGVDGHRRSQIHAAHHVGVTLCLTAAEVQGLRAALGGFAVEGGVAARLEEAERRATEDGAVLGTLVASVVVDETAQRVVPALEAAPPSGPPRGPARARRKRR